MAKLINKIINMAALKACRSVQGVYECVSSKISYEKGRLVLDVFVTLQFGVKIPEISWEIQNNIKKLVSEVSPDTDIKAINIHIEGVSLSKGNEEEEII